MLLFDPSATVVKMFVIVAALFCVFVTGLGIGFLVGLVVGNTAIGDSIHELFMTYQAVLDEELGYE